MGDDILLKSKAGDIAAYLATPKGTAQGGVVVIQEIFGVNHHIRAMCDRFAAIAGLGVFFAACFAPAAAHLERRSNCRPCDIAERPLLSGPTMAIRASQKGRAGESPLA